MGVHRVCAGIRVLRRTSCACSRASWREVFHACVSARKNFIRVFARENRVCASAYSISNHYISTQFFFLANSICGEVFLPSMHD